MENKNKNTKKVVYKIVKNGTEFAVSFATETIVIRAMSYFVPAQAKIPFKICATLAELIVAAKAGEKVMEWTDEVFEMFEELVDTAKKLKDSMPDLEVIHCD